MGIQLDGINNEIKSQTKIDFPGSVGVAGTLTYEDVTNVDSIGIVTARTGVIVGSGVTLNATGVIATGIITASSYRGDGSQLTGVTGTTINNNADNRLITGSGSANTLNGESTLTFDGSLLKLQVDSGEFRVEAANGVDAFSVDSDNGNTIIGSSGTLTIPDTIVHAGDTDTKIRFPDADKITAETGGSERLRIKSDGTLELTQHIYLNSTDKKIYLSSDYDQYITANAASNYLVFGVANQERVRIDSSGRLLINAPHPKSHGSVNNGSINASYEYQGSRSSSRDNTGARGHLVFYNPNGHVGGVNTNGSSTSFNTSSDYRLKENVVAISDGITRLKTLKPSRFNFKKDADVTVDGFLAHEVTAVPESITGIKDEVVTQALVDSGEKDESELGDPIYQQIDQAKLVPLLTAALQEAITKIETLETKVAALEGS